MLFMIQSNSFSTEHARLTKKNQGKCSCSFYNLVWILPSLPVMKCNIEHKNQLSFRGSTEKIPICFQLLLPFAFTSEICTHLFYQEFCAFKAKVRDKENGSHFNYLLEIQHEAHKKEYWCSCHLNFLIILPFPKCVLCSANLTCHSQKCLK